MDFKNSAHLVENLKRMLSCNPLTFCHTINQLWPYIVENVQILLFRFLFKLFLQGTFSPKCVPTLVFHNHLFQVISWFLELVVDRSYLHWKYLFLIVLTKLKVVSEITNLWWSLFICKFQSNFRIHQFEMCVSCVCALWWVYSLIFCVSTMSVE